MAGYGQRHWHKVTEKPDDCTDVVVVYIPTNEYATAMCGAYSEITDKVYSNFGQVIKLSECLKWCYAKDFYAMDD